MQIYKKNELLHAKIKRKIAPDICGGRYQERNRAGSIRSRTAGRTEKMIPKAHIRSVPATIIRHHLVMAGKSADAAFDTGI
jgi:hypothetical protein